MYIGKPHFMDSASIYSQDGLSIFSLVLSRLSNINLLPGFVYTSFKKGPWLGRFLCELLNPKLYLSLLIVYFLLIWAE